MEVTGKHIPTFIVDPGKNRGPVIRHIHELLTQQQLVVLFSADMESFASRFLVFSGEELRYKRVETSQNAYELSMK